MISVIIPVYNGAATLGAQLDALAQQSFAEQWELLVVDNGSHDASVRVATNWSHQVSDRIDVRVLHCEPRGVNEARNAGVRAATGALLAFLDQDDLADPGWLAAMHNALGRHRLVGGRIDYDRLNSAFVLGTRRQLPLRDGFAIYEGAPFALGSNMACRRDVFTEIGVFDGRFTYGGDDTDFFFHAHLAGIDAHFEPAAVVARRERETMSGYLRQWYRYTVAAAQLTDKFRRSGDIAPQTTASFLAALRGHLSELAAVGLIRSRTGRWKYAQGIAKAAGSVTGAVRYRQLAP